MADLASPTAPLRAMHVIGFGAVGQAWYRLLTKMIAENKLKGISGISYWAPEVKEYREEGMFKFHPIPFVTRETLIKILDGMSLKAGDIVIELATRIDTRTIWGEVKKRGCHFMNSGFDVWADVTLDLAGIEEMTKDPLFSKGTGLTSVFSFGCNPGIASHFVRHGLFAATGIADTKEAAKAFGLRSISFNERDTQWPAPGTAGEKKLLDTQLDVLYNTWSPGNYIVETAESTILFAGSPEEIQEISSAGPAVVGWVPTGPHIGFMAPHDETFTIQGWFEKEIPAVFVYEAPPTARAYIKGGRQQHSSVATCKLLTPAAYDLAAPGYDLLGALMFSDKPDTAPFWCGISLNVAEAAAIDPAGGAGPTAFQVTGGVWTALQFILEHPSAGDCWPEDVPTAFVVEKAFPTAGTLIARPAPEALAVPGLFDPGLPKEQLIAQVLAGEPAPGRAETVDGRVVAKIDLALGTAVTQLSYEGSPLDVARAAGFAHSCAANAYVDRNRAVRTAGAIPAGAAITVDYSLLAPTGGATAIAACSCGAAGCRGAIGDASSVPKAALVDFLSKFPVILDEQLRAVAGVQ